MLLRTFALIVSGHLSCARKSSSDGMPRHALSTRAVKEMYCRDIIIVLVGFLISMHGSNALKCSVTLDFLLINHFL